MIPDAASYLNFAVIVQAFFSVVYLSGYQWRRNRWLVLVFAVMLLLQIGIFLTRGELTVAQKVLFGNPGMVLWIAPALYLFTRQTIGIETETRRGLLHFLPGGLFYLLFLFQPVLHPETFIESIRQGEMAFVSLALFITNIIVTFYYGYASLRLITYNRQKVRQEYAETSIYYNLDWLKYAVISMLALTLVAVVTMLFSQWIGAIAVPFFVFEGVFLTMAMGLSFFAFRQPTLYSTEEPASPEGASGSPQHTTAKPLLTAEELTELDQRVAEYFNIEQPYLDPRIRMPALANKLGVTSNGFSWYLNEHRGRNFFTFINEFRVRHAAELLRSPDHAHYTLEAISEMAGFRSRTTFVNRFKEVLGVTPSTYRRG